MKRRTNDCRTNRRGELSYYIDLTMDELLEVCEDYIELLDDHWYETNERWMLDAMEQLKSVIVLFNDPEDHNALSTLNGYAINRCEVFIRRHWETLHPCVIVDTERDRVTLVDHGAVVEFLFIIDGKSNDKTVENIMQAVIDLKENYRRRKSPTRERRSTRPAIRGEITMRDIIDVHGKYSYKFDLSVDGLIAACDEQIKYLYARRFRAHEHEMLKAMEHLKCVPVLFKEPDNDAVRLLNGKTIDLCVVTKQRYDDTDYTCVTVETFSDHVTLVDYGNSVELIFYIDEQTDEQCISRIWRAATVLNEKFNGSQPVKSDRHSTKPKAKVKPTTKGETKMAIIPTQPTKPITLSKPSKASDYDLPLRDDLQWLAQNVSNINHHFELASFGQTLHLGKSTDDTPPSFSAKLVVRPTTIVTESTYEVTLIWKDVEYVDGVFRTSRYPEFHSKEVTDFYQVAQQVKHSRAPAISELFYSAAIHLDYQRGGYIVNQDNASGGKKS